CYYEALAGPGKKPRDGQIQKIGTVIIIVIQLLKNVAARDFNADVQLGSQVDRAGNSNITDPRNTATQIGDSLFPIVYNHQLGVPVRLPREAAKSLRNEPPGVLRGHDAGYQLGLVAFSGSGHK